MKTLRPQEIAQHCQVTHRAVLQWIADGKIKAYRTPGNHKRVHIDDFIHFLNEYQMPIPESLRTQTQQKKKVLIIDDEKTVTRIIEKILQKDYDVEIAYDGFSAGYIFKDFKPDLITLDINMPGINGLDVCEMLREIPANAHVKILVVTAVQDESLKNKILKLGADDVLYKPFKAEELLKKIELHLQAPVLST